METEPSPPPTPEPVNPTWEIAYQWRLLWRGLKWTVVGAVAFLALMAVGQIYLFHQIFSDVHPFLGWAFIAAITGFGGWLIGVPLWRFFRTPEIAHPPDVDLQATIVSAENLMERFDFDDAYLKNITNNSALAARHEAARLARKDLAVLRLEPSEGLAQKLGAFERERIAPLLDELDKQIDDYIHKEALTVGSATAISMNGSIDAFVVLWRNVNMISRIARLYYGRPSLRLSAMIIRDVMFAVLISRAMDDIADAAGDALGRVVSRLGGAIIGPLMDGSVNALMTLKLGYLAKKRCRSFDVWSKASASRAALDVFERVKRESAGLTGELVKATSGIVNAAGRAATDAAGKIVAAPKSAWGMMQDVFVKKTEKKTVD